MPRRPVLGLSLAFFVLGCGPRRPPLAPAATAQAVPHEASPGELASGPAAPPLPETDCTPAPVEDESEGDRAMVDDGFEAPAAAPGESALPIPFAELTDAELMARLRGDLGALGSMSIGGAHAGVLVAGTQMPAGESWEVVSPALAWGTKETVDALVHALGSVAERFPGSPHAFVGNLSARNGGYLPPHVSHQSGRDVDLGYYLTTGHRWYAAANAANLDRARTWHLVRTLIADSDVDLILMDVSVQRLLKSHAREIGEDPAWLDQIFQVGGKAARPLVFHAKGHATHLHVRFYSPAAQELGRRMYRTLVARRLVTPPTTFITHTTRAGETLSHLALHYKVTPEIIKKANGMTTDRLRVDRPYRIPQTGGIAAPGRVAVPPRRVPPRPVAPTAPAIQPCKRPGS
ncbi:MAG: hypothetical protein JWP97_1145 [Labilithrix sp.]|nr:hypothetical protein [Labilithrix sp.]